MGSRLDIEISLQLEVLPSGKILVPGCEPTSVISSAALSKWLQLSGCANGALVDLDEALEAIPNSYVKHGRNYNRGNWRQRWFVLPSYDTDCPCDDREDWYQILKDLASEELPEEESYDHCDTIGMGYCPSPDFDDVAEPPDNPYDDRNPFGHGDPDKHVGILPPIPDWMVKQ